MEGQKTEKSNAKLISLALYEFESGENLEKFLNGYRNVRYNTLIFKDVDDKIVRECLALLRKGINNQTTQNAKDFFQIYSKNSR